MLALFKSVAFIYRVNVNRAARIPAKAKIHRSPTCSRLIALLGDGVLTHPVPSCYSDLISGVPFPFKFLLRHYLRH